MALMVVLLIMQTMGEYERRAKAATRRIDQYKAEDVIQNKAIFDQAAIIAAQGKTIEAYGNQLDRANIRRVVSPTAAPRASSSASSPSSPAAPQQSQPATTTTRPPSSTTTPALLCTPGLTPTTTCIRGVQ